MSSPAWRKAILLNRSVLLSAWPRHFPKHDFVSLRLLPACEPIRPWPEEELWARAARAYHDERKRNSKVPV
jgi:hypothetical protein